MEDTVILFLYHKKDATTLVHYNMLIEHNPECLVIPLTDSIIGDTISGTVDVSMFNDDLTKTENKWRDIDITVYAWFKHQPVLARRYVFIEYDVYVSANLRAIYGESWGADACTADYITPLSSPNWIHFRETKKLPSMLQKYAAGTRPFVGTLLSLTAMQKVVDAFYSLFQPKCAVISELRLGTLLNYCGVQVRDVVNLNQTIKWHEYFGDCASPGVYHSIKSPTPQFQTQTTFDGTLVKIRFHNNSAGKVLIHQPLEDEEITHPDGNMIVVVCNQKERNHCNSAEVEAGQECCIEHRCIHDTNPAVAVGLRVYFSLVLPNLQPELHFWNETLKNEKAPKYCI